MNSYITSIFSPVHMMRTLFADPHQVIVHNQEILLRTGAKGVFNGYSWTISGYHYNGLDVFKPLQWLSGCAHAICSKCGRKMDLQYINLGPNGRSHICDRCAHRPRIMWL